MAFFSALVAFLQVIYFFNFIALLLILVVLYYLFEYLLDKKTTKFTSKARRQWVSIILSIIITLFCFFFLFNGVDIFVMTIGVMLFFLAVLFMIAVATGRLFGVNVYPKGN